MQLPLVFWIQLLEAVQRHDGLLAHVLLGVPQALYHHGVQGADEVRADQLGGDGECCADCKREEGDKAGKRTVVGW